MESEPLAVVEAAQLLQCGWGIPRSSEVDYLWGWWLTDTLRVDKESRWQPIYSLKIATKTDV